jgi:hypothetical protein
MFRKSLIALVLIIFGLISTAGAEVLLNEVYYNTPSADDPNALFTELWGTPNSDIGGWTVTGIHNNVPTALTIPDGTHIPTDGYFVIGNTALVPNVDWVCGGAVGQGVDWQNSGGTNGCIGIELRDVDGNLVDRVCYGTCLTTPPACDGGGSTVPFVSPGQSMARIPDHHNSGNNGADWQLTNTLTPGAVNEGVPCHTRNVALSEIRQNTADGVPVLKDTVIVVRGIVNVANHVLGDTSHTSFFFQDDDAGVNIYGGYTNANVVPGDCVLVTARVAFYYGLTELKYDSMGSCGFVIEPRGHVNPPTPTLITGSSPMESYEGMLVRMNNVSIISGTWPVQDSTESLVVTDGNGTIGLFISRWTDIDGSAQPQGAFNLVGVMSQYDRTAPYHEYYEIEPRSMSDIMQLAADDPNAAPVAKEFELVGAYPNPFNSTAQISFEVGSARELTLSISDILGREVLNQKLTGLTPGVHTFSWTPTGATGLYLARLSGRSETRTTKLLYLR